MGEDPDSEEFTEGRACPDCAATLFADGTPKYILLTVWGCEACPPWTGPVPNGAFRLTQAEFVPCLWMAVTDGLDIGLIIGNESRLEIIHDGGEGEELFTGNLPGACKDEFESIQDNCWEGWVVVGGTARATWGPSIHF